MSKNVGDYTLLNKLGIGSFAQVYKAQHKSGLFYAIKIISKEKIGSTKLQQNLDSEISIMRDYRHENIVQLYDHFKSSRHIYLVLEYCPGGDLQKFIKKNGRLSENMTRKFLLQLARGLNFLHGKNIIHRDIKPQNILLTEASEDAIIKYADFGFAKHLVEASMAQTPCGTPLYMAPEIFEMQEYNVKADIWSLGCVVFEMLVGGPPFTGQNPRELFMNIRSRHIRIPNDVFISTELQQLLLRMLEIDPRKRIDLLSLLAEAERLQPSFKVEVNESSSFENQQPLDEIYESSEQKYSSETLVMSPTVADEQPLQRQPSGIAIGLSGSSGSMRRVRSRDQISGNISSSPPTVGTLAAAPVSTSPASQRPASVTSATATMIMALANTGGGTNSPSSGTSPSQGNMVPKHRRTSSGDRRYSAGDLSPVTKALSISKGDINDRPPTSTETSKVKDSSNFQLANSRGNTMVFGLSGPIDQGRGVAMARSQAKTYDNEGEDSDDFVMVEQTPGHPWKAFPNEPTQPQANASGIVNWSNNSDQYNMSGMIAQDESMNFQATANRCAYMVQMITAITEVADKMVRDSLHPRFWKSDKKRLTDVESKENKSNIPDDESVGSHSSGDRSNRPRSFDMSQLPELLAPPFALYLHAITFLHDTIQRTLKFKETASMDSTRNLLDALIEGLSRRFEQILQRAENCKKYITSTQILPVPEQLLYQHALQHGQEASVDELLGNFDKASQHYQVARILIDCILMTASESSDRKVLQQFIQMFTDQQTVCQESKSML